MNVLTSAGVTLRSEPVRSSVGETRPAASSTACCMPTRSRSTARPSPNETRAGASSCAVCSRYRAFSALNDTCLAGMSSVAVAVICTGASTTLCKSEDSLRTRASNGPSACMRAFAVIPFATMLSATNCNATFGRVVGSSIRPVTFKCSIRLPPTAASRASSWILAQACPLDWTKSTSAATLPSTSCPIHGLRSAKCAMRMTTRPCGRRSPARSVTFPSACALFQTARSMAASNAPSAFCRRLIASARGAASTLPCRSILPTGASGSPCRRAEALIGPRGNPSVPTSPVASAERFNLSCVPWTRPWASIRPEKGRRDRREIGQSQFPVHIHDVALDGAIGENTQRPAVQLQALDRDVLRLQRRRHRELRAIADQRSKG